MVRTIEEISVDDVEKRKIPSKHYVYVIYVTWSDGSTNIIYRRYSRFFDFQSDLMEMYPEEAGSVDPSKRIIPFLPGKKFFGRSHIRDVAVKRLGPIADYCKQIVKLPRKISQCKEVLEFFEMDPEDMNPPKGKKASMKAKKISTPKPLQVYVACTEYKKQEKGEVSLKIGMLVEVVEKTETGWWFVNADEEQGWVPSTCLQWEDGEQEESSVRFKPGQEEQYLSTEEFKAEGEDEISMERGAVVEVIEKNLEGWWLVRYNGREGYVPATYLMKTEAFQVRKKQDLTRTTSSGPQMNRRKQDLARTTSGGPQIVRSLHEVSDLLKEDKLTAVPIDINSDNEFDDTYNEPEEEIYTIHEISKILKENKQGDMETEEINRNIRNAKSRSLTRGGSIRPPPRPSIKPKFGEKSPKGVKPVMARLDSLSLDYVTIADFDDTVGDGISFSAGQQVKILEKSEGGWWYIQIEGQEGWAPATYIEKTSDQTATPQATRGLPPPPPPPANKSKFKSGSREDLTKDDEQTESPRRISTAMEGLKDALKAKMPYKDKGPPTPPKKDFLSDDESEQAHPAARGDIRASTAKAAFEKSGSHGMQIPLKPGAQNKHPTRSLLQAPPPPPQAAKTASKPEIKTDSRPLPPVKVKSEIAQVSKPVTNSDDEEERGTVNVAGLAGALKAKFEGKGSDKSGPVIPSTTEKPKSEQKPTPPSFTHKPTPTSLAQKPTPPSLTQKPTPPSFTQKPTPPSLTQKPTPPSFTQKPTPTSLAQKPTPPSLTQKPTPPSLTQKPKPVPPSSAQKPKTDTKPTPPTAGQKPKVDGIKPVLNKVEFPNANKSGPSGPGKPFTNKPPSVNAVKPAWAKNDSENASKPPWVKPDSDSATKPTTKPAWAKHDTDKNSKPTHDSSSAAKPSWTKPDVDKPSKPAWAKHAKNDTDKKPPWVKHEKDSNSDSSSGIDTGATKVSDLASVLKSKFENKGKSDTDSSPAMVTSAINKREGPPPLPSTDNKPGSAVKPKPARPGSPPSSRRSDPKKLDPSKYSSRPLPPKPAKDNKDEGSSSNQSIAKKPLPSLPVKPKGGISGAGDNQTSRDAKDNADSDDDVRPMGVSGLANALKAKLGGAQKSHLVNNSGHNTAEPVSKPLPSVPVKKIADSVVHSTSDLQNNNEVSKENTLNAIADHEATNEGEMSLVIGQQYELLEQSEGWWYVSSGSQEGWAPSNYFEYSRDSNLSSTSQTAHSGMKPKQSVFRTYSDFTAENEGEISVPSGQEITVVDRQEGGWWFVQYNGNEGWVPEAYLQEV